LVLGGIIPEERRLYPATILVDLEPGMEAFDNELFGPAASVMRAKMMLTLLNWQTIRNLD
jgi:succinate-semialdehyde dehydrogenase/glutarate-semialdehyde dehydrogenase